MLAALLERVDAFSVVEALAIRPDARRIGGSLMGKARTQAKKAAGRKNVSKARRALGSSPRPKAQSPKSGERE